MSSAAIPEARPGVVAAVAATGHARYLALCDPFHPAYHEQYAAALAGTPVPARPSPRKPRVPLGTPHCGPCRRGTG